MEVKVIGRMDHTIDNTFESANRVYDKEGVCPTIPTNGGGDHVPKVIQETEKQIVRMIGRNPERPTDRTAGLPTEQRLETNAEGIANALTTVQKDNMVLEKKIQRLGQISNEGSQCGTVVSENGLAQTISAGTHGYGNPHICTENAFYEQAIKTAEIGKAEPGDVIDAFNGKVLKNGISPTITTRPEGIKTAILPVTAQYRIRKLTPRECWRLMGYTDDDYDKAEKVNSNTQLYKQAGNAIVKQVLMALFLQMNIKSATPSK